MKKLLALTAACAVSCAIPVAGLAQAAAPASQTAAPVTQTAVREGTATVDSIDYAARVLTLKRADGTMQLVKVGPDVTRFNSIKVGDTVTYRYQESLVYKVVKPGTTSAEATPAVTKDKGEKPGGTISQSKTEYVTVTAIDPKIPAITVKGDNGNVASFKVDDPKNIVGLKVGDRVQITYTLAVAISVK